MFASRSIRSALLLSSKQSNRINALRFSHHKVYPPIPVEGKTVQQSQEEYRQRYSRSISDIEGFWADEANKFITWFKPFEKVLTGDFTEGTAKWFEGGKLNACYNALDRHLPTKGDRPALIWEGDEPGDRKVYSYKQMQEEVSKIANVMKAQGVKKGDVVTIYMPMIPQLPMVMLACARIGAIHSVVFAGFSAEALKDRIKDCKSKWVFAADEGKRGGKAIKLKQIADDAIAQCPDVKKLFVFKRTGAEVKFNADRDLWMEDLLPSASSQCPVEVMDSEDPLFIIYTSGSTGKPKGVVHSTAGYLLYTTMAAKNTFDLRENDVFCSVADCGWITGHSYVVYGPLTNGITATMFESIPTYPDPYRYWDLIQSIKATHFYTAPTAIRALMRFSEEPIKKFDLSSVRLLGTAGEPTNPEAWEWYYENVGHSKKTILDTYWQTETGGPIVTNLPGVTPMKPGACSSPFYGIELAVLDSQTGKEIQGNNVEGVLAIKKPWPGLARTVYGDHERFLSTYMKPYGGYYFTGDACRRDADGSIWITGRVDDVINPSGHRIGTAELEGVLDEAEEVSESAVVGFPHPVKGDGIGCFVILKEGVQPSEQLSKKLRDSIRSTIGPFAAPDFIIYSDLPKTRSGKIMRRILRKIASGESDSLGDISTLADPSVVPKLVEQFKTLKNAQQ